jgi:hypothetical protein
MLAHRPGIIAIVCSGSFFLSTVFFPSAAQQLDRMLDNDPVAITGSLSSQLTVFASQRTNSRPPFTHQHSGALNISVYGWEIPLSFTYSNRQSDFRQPFNQYGISPSYKNVTAHIGYRTMSLSDYTVSGYLFLGGGLETIVSKKLKLAAFYGRLQKAVADTSFNREAPLFKRMGGGIKASYVHEDSECAVVLFKANDDRLSLPSDVETSPTENFASAIIIKHRLSQRLSFDGELACSVITNDTKAQEISGRRFYERSNFFYGFTISTGIFKAYRTGIQYAFNRSQLGLIVENVDPGYSTFGTYYFNSNINRQALTFSTSIRHKVNIALQAGIQRDNLDPKVFKTTQRFGASGNLTFPVSRRVTLTGSFTNFSTTVNFRQQGEDTSPPFNTDSLDIRQVMQSCNLSTSVAIGSRKDVKQNFAINSSLQKTAAQQTQVLFLTAYPSYTFLLTRRQLSYSIASSGSMSQSREGRSNIIGLIMSARKGLSKHSSLQSAISFNNSKNSIVRSQYVSARLSFNQVAGKHSFAFFANHTVRMISGIRSRNESMFQLNYSFRLDEVRL